ncbi:hypothetical protein BUE80_DR002618 [Diplocarpon rosae]|nr:hypothetical protein BUE80_DR002618 [Diplocarpon rosae]
MRPILAGVKSHSNNINPNSEYNYNLNSKADAHTNATPPRRLSKLFRPPLLDKTSHAHAHANIMRAPTLTGKSTSSNMPTYDKNAARPPKPTFSAAAKSANRSPLTPRVAGSVPPTTATPSSRRPARSESTTPGAKEDLPVSTFLCHNVTPRSGPRRVRIGSPNSTPTANPSGISAPGDLFKGADASVVYTAGLGITGIEKDIPKRPYISPSPSASEVVYSKAPAQNGSGDSKFFFASEAKTAQPSRPPLQARGSSTFFYANGDSVPDRPKSSSASAVGSIAGEDRSQPKFFHANGTPDLPTTSSSYFPPPRPSSVLSSSSRTAPPRQGLQSTGPLSSSQRPASPSKLNQYASISSICTTPVLPPPDLTRPQQPVRGQSTNSIVSARRVSIEATQRSGHSRSGSASSADGKILHPARKMSANSYESPVPGSPLSLATSAQQYFPEEVLEEATAGILGAGFRSPILSPVKTNQSIDELNELAANARRERKVLDLEITNSSLAAINRTLEREMRKQAAELRSYRRLSRSGRLSIATAKSIRTSTDSFAGNDGEGLVLSDMSEEEEFQEADNSEEETSDESSVSPSTMEESDLRHRKRDEKRLQLDLSKHQQLLIDSQKMNQSLKRCLGWTEELISEGRKALEYRVRITDVRFGGRVLAPDELDPRDAEEVDNEGMSDIGARFLREARKKAAANGRTSPPWGGIGRDDRDSGIELDGTQQEQISTSLSAEHSQ